VKAAFAAGVEKYGKIDALANIAGVLDVAMRPIDDFLTSDLDTTLTVNVKGTMYVTRAAVKQFIAQGYDDSRHDLAARSPDVGRDLVEVFFMHIRHDPSPARLGLLLGYRAPV